jgi:tetratricopeptide (TPR) repeat protein
MVIAMDRAAHDPNENASGDLPMQQLWSVSGLDPQHALQEAILYHAQGRLREAEQLYQGVLRSDACHFDTLYRLGSLCAQQGRFSEASHLARRAIKIKDNFAEVHQLLGVALTGLNLHQHALPHYEKALALKPNYAEAHNNLGYSLQSLGRFNDSITYFTKALVICPTYPEAHNNLGNTYLALKQFEQAIDHFREALTLRPNYAEAHHNLANCLLVLGRREEALAEYRKAFAINSNYADAYHGHGKALEQLDRIDEAILQYEKALSINPNHIDARIVLGNALHQLGRLEEALAHYDKALAIDPLSARVSLGNALQRLGRSEEALTHYNEAQAINPHHFAAHIGRGDAFMVLGKLDEARNAYETAITLSPRATTGYLRLAHCKRFNATDRHFLAIWELAQQIESLPTGERTRLHFALGKALADIGEQEKSFAHFLQGNALKRQDINYDESQSLGVLERIREVFTRELMWEKSGPGDPSCVPIFIIGMPRSGTTLVEQILASHQKVFAAGELQELGKLANGTAGPNGRFPETVRAISGEELRRIGGNYLRKVRGLAPKASWITDKMTGNFALAGFAHLILPNARIIHTGRDPCDTALSCFSLLFEGRIDYSYDLAELGRYYRAYRKLMMHWRDVLPPGLMLEVQYEDVVSNLEREARRIVAHCGLEWDDACLGFHTTNRPVLTASAVQVRRPIYQSSVGRSRPYERLLQPFVQALGADGGSV